jgi:hypothetical protein
MKETTRAYAAGFVDAEGCIAIGKNNSSASGLIYSARITVSNRSKEVIDYLVHHFGGYYTRSKPPNERCNENYLWHVTSSQHIERFLSQIYPYLRVKSSQADVLREYLAMGRANNPSKREELYRRVRDLKNEVRVTTETLTSSNLDAAYLAGFFDGEGLVSIISFVGHGHRQHAARINVTNTDLPILEMYQHYFGGSIRKHSKPRRQTYRWELRKNEDRQKFLLDVLAYLNVKHEEACTVLEFLRLGSAEDPAKRNDFYQRLVSLKKERMIQSHLHGDMQSAPAETL